MVMDIRSALSFGTKLLKDNGIESSLDAKVLLCHVLNKDELYLVVHGKDEISPQDMSLYKELLCRREKKEPVSYITGHKEFMGLDFSVKPGVLIPRPETEHIVEYIIENYKDKAVDVLDICTGSGAIGVSIAHFLKKSHVTCVDISPVALEIAQLNAQKLGVDERVTVVEKDALSEMDFGKKFDIVISNPPYIPDDVVLTLSDDVKNYEPHLALSGGEDGLIFYHAITKNAPSFLKKDGLLIYETGHDMGHKVKDIMKDNFKDIEFIKDLAGYNRVVYGFLK
jgi:release factor-specific protein-(glutamine-N5) methyltransferase